MGVTSDKLKYPSYIALSVLGLLLVTAFIYYKERLLFADASFIAFNIINYKSMGIQEHRYGSFITQVVPYFGSLLRLPIKAILMGYAVSFNLFYFLVAAVLVFGLKQYRLAILMAFYYFLFVSDSYFWTNNEIHQAVAWMFLFYGLILYTGSKRMNIFMVMPLFILLGFLTVTTHYVVIIPMVFLWVYLWIEKKHWPFSRNISVLLSGLLLVVIGIKYALTPANNYDGTHLHNITHFSFQDIFDSFSTSVVSMFLYRCLTNYWIAIIIFVTGIIALIRARQAALAIWTVASALGYFIIMGITYCDITKDIPLFHIESEWACIGIIVGAPFVFTFLPSVKPRAAMWLLILIFIIRLPYFNSAMPPWRWRTHFKERVLAQMKKKGITKLGLVTNDDLRSRNILDWAVPYEGILLSALNGDKPQPVFLFVDDNGPLTQSEMAGTKTFNLHHGAVPSRDLNPRYFSIDTTHPYQVMTYDELMK